MAKVLKITKPDRTIHVSPTKNKPFFLAFNRRQPAEKKWTIEEVDEEDTKELPFVDDSYVSPLEAVQKSKTLAASVVQKDEKIAELQAELDAKKKGKLPADLLISLIGTAATAEQVEALSKDDDRVTVKTAADKRLSEIKPTE